MFVIVAIHQPNFLPWLGFFHKLLSSDVFILLDNVQLPRGKTLCSRVLIKKGEGSRWLTVPVGQKGQMVQIYEAPIDNRQPWKRKHLGTLQEAYRKAPYFQRYYPRLVEIYEENFSYLADFNRELLMFVLDELGAETRLVWASQIHPQGGGKTDNLISLIKGVGGSSYITGKGKGSLRYLEENRFEQEGINLIWQEFSHPHYPQVEYPFVSHLSIIDLLFNCGGNSRDILLAGGEKHES